MDDDDDGAIFNDNDEAEILFGFGLCWVVLRGGWIQCGSTI